MTTKKWFCFLCTGWCIIILGILIWIPVFIVQHLTTLGTITIDEKMAVIISTSVLILSIVIGFISMNMVFYQPKWNQAWQLYLFSIISLNIFALLLLIKFGEKLRYQQQWIKKMRTFDLLIMGMTVAIFLLLDFINSLVPALPFFISISFQLVPLFFFAFLADFVKSFCVCLISGLIVWFMPNNADAAVSFWAYLFDYLLPVLAISLASLAKPRITANQTNIQKMMAIIQWFSFIGIPLTIGYLSKVISGVLFWFNSSWGWNRWLYSFIYNAFNFGVDLAFSFIVVPLVCRTLLILKTRYYS